MKTHDLTQGSITKGLISFSVPILLAMFLQSLYGAVDLLVVGRFAATADVSGVATGSLLMQTLTCVAGGLAMGVTLHIAQCVGRGDRSAAGRALGCAVCLFTLIGVGLSLCLGLFSPWFARLLQTPPEAMAQTTAYIRICGWGGVCIVGYNLLGAIFRGMGDSRTPLVTVAIACVLNILGDLLFVARFHMGAAGAALATVLSQGVSVLISLLWLARGGVGVPFRRCYLRLQRDPVASMVRLGSPIALQELLVGLSFVIIQTVANALDVVSSAGVGVGDKVCAFIMLVPSAYMQSIATFVAQNRAAGRHVRVGRAMRIALGSALVIGLVFAVGTFVRGDALTALFADDPAVVQAAFWYLKGYALDCLLVSVLFCLVGYFNGRGDTFFVMLQGIVGAIAVRVPLTLLLGSLPGTSLLRIGLATPSATVVQIGLCVWYLLRTRGRTGDGLF